MGALKNAGEEPGRQIKTALQFLDAEARTGQRIPQILLEPKRILEAADRLKGEAARKYLKVACLGAMRFCDVCAAEAFPVSKEITGLKIIGGKTSKMKPQVTHVMIPPTEIIPFPKNDTAALDEIRRLLKEMHPYATLRSVRSSMTMAMAMHGVEKKTILDMTKHTTEDGLWTYIEYGVLDQQMITRTTTAQAKVMHKEPVEVTLGAEMPRIFEEMNAATTQMIEGRQRHKENDLY